MLQTILLQPHHLLSDAMQKISASGINLVLVTDEQRKLLGVINEKIAREFLLKGGHIQDSIDRVMIRDPVTARNSDSQNKISELLLSGINHLPILDDLGRVVDVEFRAEKIRDESYPIVRGKAPLRISFAGGGTDKQHFFEKHGGVVINATVDKYCYATMIKRADSKIIIDSDVGEGIEVIADSRKDLAYDGKCDLIKAIVNIMKPPFGFELYLHNDVPPGRGLGSSATLSVLVINLLSYLQDIHYDDYKIAEIAYRTEREQLNIKGGWQDQYAAVTGGFNFMEFNGDKTIIYPLRLKPDVVNELNQHLLLCYVGKGHHSGDIHKNQEKTFSQNEEMMVEHLQSLKKIAIEIKDCLLTYQIEKIGSLLYKSWENKRKLDSSISDPFIDHLYEIGLKNGAYGGKLLGAGGGGYILFFYTPRKRNQLVKALEKGGGEIMNFHFEFEGTKVWPVKQKF